MDDIDSIIRLSPMEQAHYEKEQNLYSIIKTVEYLVSATACVISSRSVLSSKTGVRIHVRKGVRGGV